MSLSDADQKALIARARQGDEAAFAEVYASIEPGVLGYIGTFIRDEDEAREIAQDTCRYFFQTGMQRYDPEAGRSLLSFVKASARWAALNYLRKRAERRRVERLLSEFQSRHPDVNLEAELADFRAYVRAAATPGTETQAVDVEHQRLQETLYDELFQITFTHNTSPPHQLIVIGFRIWPDRASQAGKAVPVWPPRRIVAELSTTALTTLAGQLEDALVRAATHLSEAHIRDTLRELRRRMGQSVHDLLQQLQLHFPPWSVAVAFREGSGIGHAEELNEQQRAVITACLQRCLVGTTTFQHYYTTDHPEDDIGRWCEAVKRQVWQVIRAQGKGVLFEELQEAKARQQRAAAHRAQARQQQSTPPPSRAAGDV